MSTPKRKCRYMTTISTDFVNRLPPGCEHLFALLAYDPATGVFTWKCDRRGKAKAGDIAGSTTAKGYRAIQICKKAHYAHRLAWLFTHGEWPKWEIDHINGDGLDNRICNLREATHIQNAANKKVSTKSKTGYPGVWLLKKSGRWQAKIRLQRLGEFDTQEEAEAAYRAAALVLFGDFARLDTIPPRDVELKPRERRRKTACKRGHQFVDGSYEVRPRNGYDFRVCLACERERYAQNGDKRRAYIRDYYTANKDKEAARKADWYQRRKAARLNQGGENAL
jgi:hypothetical protein